MPLVPRARGTPPRVAGFGPLTDAIIVGKSNSTTPGLATQSLRESDVQAFADSGSPAIASVTPLRTGFAVIRNGQNAMSSAIAGTSADYLTIRIRTLAAGRFINDQDNQTRARVVVIGLVAGVYPARRASRLNPIDALRY